METYKINFGGKVYVTVIRVWDVINLIAKHDLQRDADPASEFHKGYHKARRELMQEFVNILKDKENGNEESK